MFYPFEVADPISGQHYRPSDTRLAELSLAPVAAAFTPGRAVAADPNPVWAASFTNAPVETIAAVTAALCDVILATSDLNPPTNLRALPNGRARQHLEALVELWHRIEGGLPEGLETARHVIGLPEGQFLSPLPVVEGSLDPSAPAAMRGLYARLEGEFGSVSHIPRALFAPAGSRLHALQMGLSRKDMPQGPADASLSFYGLRDPSACAEFAAAKARALIDSGLPARSIAVLTAGDPQDIGRAFAAQGIPLSGMPSTMPVRDVIGETLLNLLLTKRPPTPAMALASLCLSPLMPWSNQTGRDLAEDVIGGSYRGAILAVNADHSALWDDIRQPAGSLPQLRLLLDRICDRMKDGEVLRERLLSLSAVLIGDGPPDWDVILRAVQVEAPSVGDAERNLEGVSIWRAGESPWRPCRHLIITDFSEGYYPGRPRANALFLDSEIDLIAETANLHLRGRADGLAQSLALFEAQLGAVQESVTCLVPWRTLAGARQAPSAGLSLCSRAIENTPDAEDLIVDLSRVARSDWPVANFIVPSIPAPLPPAPDVRFGKRDLLSLRLTDDGIALPQSPSRLETLLVSPLAWLLGEIGANDMGWNAETLDPVVKGNIAHNVFEHVFLPDVGIPDEAALLAQLPDAFDDALRRNAGYLRSAIWEMERTSLEREIQSAALRWRADLVALGARILGNEKWLHGEAHGISIRGKADTILALPDGGIVIVDHKKSGTSGRKRRMEAGWDLQVGLYSDMLARPLRREDDGLDAIIGKTVGIAYHLMNDGGVLTSGISLTGAAAARDMGNAVNERAVAQLVQRLAEVGGGQIRMNTTSDAGFFEKEAGFKPYALGASPLIAAFMLEEEE